MFYFLDSNVVSIVFFAFIIGFLATVFASGPTSLLIIKNSSSKQYKKAFFITLGASAAEFVYCFSSLTIVDVLSENSFFNFATNILTSVLFLIVGGYLLFSKHRSKKREDNPALVSGGFGGFFVGMMTILFNPAVILSWSAVSAFLISINLISINNTFEIVLFSVFVFGGSVFGGSTLIFLIRRFNHFFSDSVFSFFFKVVGFILVFLSFYIFLRFYNLI